MFNLPIRSQPRDTIVYRQLDDIDGEQGMSQETIKKAIADKKMRCPQCKEPVQKYEKLVEMTSSIWDGAGDSKQETAGSKVTLICGNGSCDWKERTEFWSQYID